jgi:PAS domain S-box-containing protein
MMRSSPRAELPEEAESERAGLARAVERLQGRVEALEGSEARFNNLAEYLPGISIQGYRPDGTVIYWNKASELVYGYTAEEAMGRNLADLIIPSDLRKLFNKALEIGRKATVSGQFMPPGELHLLHKSGRLVPVYSIHTVVVDRRGEEPTLFCMDIDLSERKELERTIAELHDRLDRRVGHDLHERLAQLLAGLSMLASSLESGVSKDDREVVRMAHELAELAREAVAQSRQLSRELLPVDEEPHGLVDALRRMVAEHRGDTDVSFVLECDGNLMIGNHAVATGLFHIAREAVANALNHGAPKRIAVRLGRGGDSVLLVVEDDGRGFDVAGTAAGCLGIRSMRYRASMLGGSLCVTSQLGAGTRIECSVPDSVA